MLESLEDEDDYLNQPIDKHRVRKNQVIILIFWKLIYILPGPPDPPKTPPGLCQPLYRGHGGFPEPVDLRL